jgi:hypothetical protein
MKFCPDNLHSFLKALKFEIKDFVPKLSVKNEEVNYIEKEFVKGQDLEGELCIKKSEAK